MRVKYNYYLKINNFDKSINTILMYLRRYYYGIFNKKRDDFKTVIRQKSVSKEQPLYNYQKNPLCSKEA